MQDLPNQGRLSGLKPIAVIDIGSNSIRLVIYEGITRTPNVLFNEKVMVGLGRGVADTGNLIPEKVERALDAIKRFKALAYQGGAESFWAIATAAARDADNGPDFIRRAEEILGEEIHVLSGKEEAYYSALGVISSVRNTKGTVGDMGGGSLELVNIDGEDIGSGITVPLGGLRLDDESGGDLARAKEIVADTIKPVALLSEVKGQRFFAVGGTWRNLARMHMDGKKYPLNVMHEYEVPTEELKPFLKRVAKGDIERMRGFGSVAKSRRKLVPLGALVLLEIIRKQKPKSIVLSGSGVREGYLYSLLTKEQKALDPLIEAARELCVLRARSTRHAQELAAFSSDTFVALGIEETEDEARYRHAACLMADLSWRAHPEYRGEQALNVISHTSFIGISHEGRIYVALANYFRHEGISVSKSHERLLMVGGERIVQRAQILGAIMRVAYLLSAAMPGVLRKVHWVKNGNDFELHIGKKNAELLGERPDARLNHLSKLVGYDMRMVV